MLRLYVQTLAVAFSEYIKFEIHEKFQAPSEYLCLSLLNCCVSKIQNEVYEGSWEKLESESRVCHIEKVQ